MPFTVPDTRTFALKAATSRLHVGPHSILERNGFLFNDRSSLEGAWVDDFTGFEKADITLNEELNPQDEGGTAYRSFHGPRTMTMTGVLRAGTYPNLVTIGGLLEDSLLELVEMPMQIRVNPASPFFTQPTVFINCRPTDYSIAKQARQEDRSGIWERAFTVALRATNPRYFGIVEQHAVVVPTVTTTKGRIYARTYPLAYTTLLNPAGYPVGAGNTLTVNNAGNWSSRPRLRFTGPMDGVGLRNLTNGHFLRLKYGVAAGDWIEINVKTGEVYDQLGNPKSSYHDTGSDWLEFDGKRGAATGDNNLALEVTTFGAGAQLDAWWFNTSM